MGDAPAKARPNKAVEPTAPRAACGSSTSFMARRLTAGVRLRYCTFAGSSLSLKIN